MAKIIGNTTSTPIKPLIVTSEGEGSIVGGVNTLAISEHSGAFGDNSISGRKVFYIKSVDFDNKKIYLTNEQLEKPEVSAVDNTDIEFETPAYEAGDEFSIISGGHYPFCGVIESVSNNVITWSSIDPYFERRKIATTTSPKDQTFTVPSKPTIGCITLGEDSFSFGVNIVAAGDGSFGVGEGNIIGGDYGIVAGKENKAGFGTAQFGVYNENIGQWNLGYGSTNKTDVTTRGSIVGGSQNTVNSSTFGIYSGNGNIVDTSAGTIIAGSGNTVSAANNGLLNGSQNIISGNCNIINGDKNDVNASYVLGTGTGIKSETDNQLILGKWNETDPDAAIIYGSGGSNNTRKNTFSIGKKGNAKFNGVVEANGIKNLNGESYTLESDVEKIVSTVADFYVEPSVKGTSERIFLSKRFVQFNVARFNIKVNDTYLRENSIKIDSYIVAPFGTFRTENLVVELYDANNELLGTGSLVPSCDDEYYWYGTLKTTKLVVTEKDLPEEFVHPTHNSNNLGLYKIKTNEFGHVDEAVAVNKTDITSLGIASSDNVGSNNNVSGTLNVAIGSKNTVNNETNVVAGYDNNINGKSITALGRELNAGSAETGDEMYGATIVGRGNIPDKKASFIIGGGSATSPHNSMVINKSTKEITFNGPIKVDSITDKNGEKYMQKVDVDTIVTSAATTIADFFVEPSVKGSSERLTLSQRFASIGVTGFNISVNGTLLKEVNTTLGKYLIVPFGTLASEGVVIHLYDSSSTEIGTGTLSTPCTDEYNWYGTLVTTKLITSGGNGEVVVDPYVHPTYTQYQSGLYKVSVDNLGHVNEVSAVKKEDITKLGIASADIIGGTNTNEGTSNVLMGFTNTTAGDHNVVAGNNNTIKARYIAALGRELNAGSADTNDEMYGATIVGRGNIPDKTASFIIGSGSASSPRNAMVINKTTGNITFNSPITGTTFTGEFIGNATSATQDGSGNNIVDTYVMKTDVNYGSLTYVTVTYVYDEENGGRFEATIPNITELKAGVVARIIPDTMTGYAYLDVNGLGIKEIRRCASNVTSETYPLTEVGAGMPMELVYDGKHWISNLNVKPHLDDIDGVIPIHNGGTGVGTLEGAKEVLGITELEEKVDNASRPYQYSTIDLVAGVSELAEGTLYLVYEE